MFTGNMNNYNREGPQGVPGMQGQQGIQGVPGAQGAMGIQGIQGPSGNNTTSSIEGYANLYTSAAQSVGAYNNQNDAVLFDNQNAVSNDFFDMSMKNVNGEIKFLKHGIYQLKWELQGRLVPPIPVPVPSWSFGFWLNNVLVPGSISSGFTQAPGDDAAHSNGTAIIEIKEGDVLKLRNTSSMAVDLNANITGSVFPISIASLNIICLKPLA